ncbi:MAG: DUF721 domain-containing protein [Treponema sp.]|nr:DUF721 domain-containing protein [Treponema sp.]
MKRIGDVITSIFDEKMIEKADGYSIFFSCWKDLTEKNGIPAAAAHSWIKSLDNGLVWIEVDHPGWKQILQTKERKLLYDFRYRFPKMGISGISIMLCRPGTCPENVKSESISKTTVKEEQLPADLPETSPIADDQSHDFEYDNIKNKALKKLLMRLEKSIIEKNT